MDFTGREFTRNRDLLWLLTKKEITLKHKRTALGILWSLLNPILLALVLFVAFKIFMRIKMENYTFFLLSALFPWNWFSASITMSTGTLISNVSLIKKSGSRDISWFLRPSYLNPLVLSSPFPSSLCFLTFTERDLG